MSENETTKKSWFNRIWSAMAGLVVGVAAMFGINKQQVTEIKTTVKEAYDQVQEIQVALNDKDYGAAISNIGKVSSTLKEVIGDVKETVNTVTDTIDVYKADAMNIKDLIEAKKYAEAHAAAVSLAAKITQTVPEDQLTGTAKTLFVTLKNFIADVDAGKYDKVVEFAGKILSLFNKGAAEAPAEGTIEAPAAEVIEKN